MGVVFNIKRCVRCACLLINRRAQVRCTVDKKCMGERTVKDDTTVKIMSSRDAVREEAATRERLARQSEEEGEGKESDAYKKRKEYQKQLAEEYQSSRYPRSINIFVNRPPQTSGQSGTTRQMWRNGSGGWAVRKEGQGCKLDGKSVGFNQRIRLSKCRTCVCLKMAQPAFYCKHDPGCAQSKKELAAQQQTKRQNETRRVEKDVRCRIGSVVMTQGQVIHLKHCTLCKCVQDENKKALLSCGYDKKCQKKAKDTPLVGIDSKDVKKAEFDGCKRRGKLYSYGSGFLLGKCKVCKCARVPTGKVFICKRKASCDTKRVQKGKDSKISDGNQKRSEGSVKNSDKSESKTTKKTLIIITPEKEKPKEKEPTVFCIYQGTKTGLGKSVRISKCLACVCKSQKFNPVFDCKKTNDCVRREHEKQKEHEEEVEERREERKRRWRERRRARRRRARVRDMQLRARMRREMDEKNEIRSRSVSSRNNNGGTSRRRTPVVHEDASVSMGSSSVPVYGAAEKLIFLDHDSHHRRRDVNFDFHRHNQQHGGGQRPILHSVHRRHHHHHHQSNSYRMHNMGRSRDVLFAQDQENSGCSYAGITIPRGQKIVLNACVSCQCTGYQGDKLMCHRVKGCNPKIHYPGCRYGGVTVPRRGIVLRGGCRYCRCNFGENGFEMTCRKQRHCDVSNRSPQSLPRHSYIDVHVRGGCRLAYGVIINHGSKVFDKSSCTTCVCEGGLFHCAQHAECQQQSGCFVDGRYAAPESHAVRGCRSCVCQHQGHFNCQLNSECIRRHH